MTARRPLLRLLAVALTVVACGVVGACGDSTEETHRPVEQQAASRPSRVGSADDGAAAGFLKATLGFRGDEDDDDSSIGQGGVTTADPQDADGDNDLTDNRGKGYYDEDDGAVQGFGQPAGPDEAKALRKVVARYFAAARAGNGKIACATIEQKIGAALPENYGTAVGPAYLRGAKTCAAVMSGLFEHLRRQLSIRQLVTSIRVNGARAYVLLGSRRAPASYVTLEREGGAWRIAEIVPGALP